MIRRNHTLTKEFTLPKTEAGTDRIINLIQPAIDVLKSQAQLTRLGKQYQVEVKLREYGRTDVHPCTFVFNPQIGLRKGRAGHHYAVGSLTSLGKRQCDVPGFAIAEHTSPVTRMHAGRWLPVLTRTSSRSKWATPTRKWFTGCTDPGWLKITRTRYSSSTRN